MESSITVMKNSVHGCSFLNFTSLTTIGLMPIHGRQLKEVVKNLSPREGPGLELLGQ